MQLNRSQILAFTLVVITFTSAASAQRFNETVLYSFPQSSTDAGSIQAGVVFDSAGNLYGNSDGGGAFNAGAVYELSPAAGGGWTEQVLYSFTGGTDGASPRSNLVIDSSGNLYGVTLRGGTGYGSVYQLSNTGSGWTLTNIYTFTGGGDGRYPGASLMIDAAGNLYGITGNGGAHTFGVIYKLAPTSTGWHQSVLYSFSGTASPFPQSTLMMDAAGNLYGTTLRGGSNGRGSVYELSPPSVNSWWTFQTLHSFNGPDGELPSLDPLVMDGAGNLYGVTASGGNGGLSANGTVYRLSPTSGGHWDESVLHSFTTGFNGGLPEGGLAFDASGNLWGTTSTYGAATGTAWGTVFMLTPVSGGAWSFATIHHFNSISGGQVPLARLVFDSAGNAYGTTEFGGDTTDQEGTVFEISPVAASRGRD